MSCIVKLFVSLWLIPATISAQGLFETAGTTISDSASTSGKPSQNIAINGYVKSAIFGGQDNANDPTFKGIYTELSLKPFAKKSNIGQAFADLRLRTGLPGDQPSLSIDIREAWVAVTPGMFDIRFGRQILSWGRADGINPTNNITPMNQTALSSSYDDTRIGNELLTVTAAFDPVRVEAVWIPAFRPDIMPLSGASIPSSIAIADPVYPSLHPKNSGYALRFDLSLPELDGSLSYFDGYETQPGFNYQLGATGLSLIPTAYRIHAPGADFSMTIGSIGLRAEASVKIPDLDYHVNPFIPHPLLQYVVGGDKTIGDWMVLLQYCGQYVSNFTSLVEPVLSDPFNQTALMQFMQDVAGNEIEKLNRLFTASTDQVSHSLTGTVQYTALHETLHFELAGMYNITTKDYAVNPRASYDISDALGCSIGGRYLNGPKGGLHDLVSKILNHAYLELTLSF